MLTVREKNEIVDQLRNDRNEEDHDTNSTLSSEMVTSWFRNYRVLKRIVLAELRRAEICYDYDRKDWAFQHLHKARTYCDEYKAFPTLRQKCQDVEDEFRHRSPDPRRRQKLVRRLSNPIIRASPQMHTSLPRRGSEGSLFQKLMNELQEDVARKPEAPSLQSPCPHPTTGNTRDQLDKDLNPVEVSPPDSAAKFEGVDELLERLLEAPRREVGDCSDGTATSQRVQPDMVEKVVGWQTHQLPSSPSNFKDAEEPSPRRHSFPVASPTLPPSPPSWQTSRRKSSLHSLPSPLSPTPRDSRTQASVSICSEDSGSNYSRRRSHDETSTALSDTPALSKLVDQLQTNPFVDHSNLISAKIRRLSIDKSPLAPLTIAPPLPHETTEPTIPSPLRESINLEELPRMVSVEKSSPVLCSPLRETFTADFVDYGKAKVVGPKRPLSSRIPRPVKRSPYLTDPGLTVIQDSITSSTPSHASSVSIIGEEPTPPRQIVSYSSQWTKPSPTPTSNPGSHRQPLTPRMPSAMTPSRCTLSAASNLPTTHTQPRTTTPSSTPGRTSSINPSTPPTAISSPPTSTASSLSKSSASSSGTTHSRTSSRVSAMAAAYETKAPLPPPHRSSPSTRSAFEAGMARANARERSAERVSRVAARHGGRREAGNSAGGRAPWVVPGPATTSSVIVSGSGGRRHGTGGSGSASSAFVSFGKEMARGAGLT